MRIFESAQIGTLSLPNRLLMAPVKTAFASPEGKVTDQLVAYYRRRAEGGVGAIIVEPCYVDPVGKEHPRQLGIDADDKIAGLGRLVAAIHQAGARAVAHLNHAGRAANPKATGRPPEAPSAMVCPTTGAEAQAMSSERIGALVAAFAEAARRAKAAGFDAVELQCGLGYLVAQFLSPRTNLRTDEHGGDGERRRRFAHDVVQAMHGTLGSVPLTARLSATEQVEGGLGVEDATALGRDLESWGVLAVHVVSGSACDAPPWYYQHMSLPDDANVKLAAQIKRALRVPVIGAGRLGDPARITNAIETGEVDFVALGRPLVADPDLPRKLAMGRSDDIVSCGSCLQGCLASVKAGKGIGCIVNPEVGREAEPIEPAERAKHVVIVGGGPAGLTAAVVARKRGHRVTLLERAELGGQFSLAPLAPGKAAMGRPLRALVHQAVASGADIRTGTEATVESIVALAPDVVVLAAGATPIMPAVPGLDRSFTGNQLLAGEVAVGERVLVVGGGLVGIEVAELLAERGNAVTVVEMLDEVARDMEAITRAMTMKRLAKRPVEIHVGTAITRFADRMATVRSAEGERQLGPFDSVVVAVGTRPRRELAAALIEQGLEVHAVGDALELKQIMGAVRSAWEVARRI